MLTLMLINLPTQEQFHSNLKLDASLSTLLTPLKLGLVKTLNFKFCGDAVVWLRFLVDADLCLNL